MELTIFARFYAQPGRERAVAEALRAQVPGVRDEPGCLDIHAFRSTRDPRLFYIHSRWTDATAFEAHAVLPRTVRFVETMEALIDHPFEATRAEQID
jgi:quinol monooxygenase YgiN